MQATDPAPFGSFLARTPLAAPGDATAELTRSIALKNLETAEHNARVDDHDNEPSLVGENSEGTVQKQ